jgi:hypothetical protein
VGFADLLNLDILKIAVSIDCNCPSDKTIQDNRFDLKVPQKIHSKKRTQILVTNLKIFTEN